MVITEREEVISGTLSPGRGTHSQYLYWFLPSPEAAGSDEDDDDDLVDGDDDDAEKSRKRQKTNSFKEE